MVEDFSPFDKEHLIDNLHSIKNIMDYINKNLVEIIDCYNNKANIIAILLSRILNIPCIIREETPYYSKSFERVINLEKHTKLIYFLDDEKAHYISYEKISKLYQSHSAPFLKDLKIDNSKIYYKYKIDSFVDSTKDSIIFGMNPYAYDFADLLKNNPSYKGNILCFCDDNSQKWGKLHDGIEVFSTKQVLDKYKDRSQNIQILNLATNHHKILAKWNDLGFNDVRRMGNYGPEDFQPDFYDEAIKYILKTIDKVEQVYTMIEDDKSRQVYEHLVYMRLFSNPDFMLDMKSETQYFDEDFLSLGEEEVFVDGGSFIAETVSNLLTRTDGKVKMVYSFEPDDRMYPKVLENLEKMIPQKDKYKAIKGGLYSITKKLYLDVRKPGASKVKEAMDENSASIDVYALDDILKERTDKITYIKMDIEGSEISAIEGAKSILKNDQPKLGICIYHLPEDIVSIPLLIKSINNNYKIYFRHYTIAKSESVVYAI